MLHKQYLYADMDGTLLHTNKGIPPANTAAIKAFVAAGGGFSVASGRSPALAVPYLTDLPINMPAIFYNGAAVYDIATETYLHKWCIPGASMRKIVQSAIAVYPQICAEICDGRPMQLVNPNCVMDSYIIAEQQVYEYATLDSCGDCFKVLFFGEHDDLLRARDAILAADIPNISLCFSAPYYLEILPAGATKGDALRWICENFGKDITQVAAIGDFENDLELLGAAGFAAAPANAEPAVKQCADVVVAHCDDGAVADLITTHLMLA